MAWLFYSRESKSGLLQDEIPKFRIIVNWTSYLIISSYNWSFFCKGLCNWLNWLTLLITVSYRLYDYWFTCKTSLTKINKKKGDSEVLSCLFGNCLTISEYKPVLSANVLTDRYLNTCIISKDKTSDLTSAVINDLS